MTTTEKLARLLEIEEKASKGPWEIHDGGRFGNWGDFGPSICASTEPGLCQPLYEFVGPADLNTCRANGELTCQSRNALRPLVKALEAAIEVIRDVSTGDDIRYESPEDDSDRILARKMESRADDARTTLARIESILSEIP